MLTRSTHRSPATVGLHTPYEEIYETAAALHKLVDKLVHGHLVDGLGFCPCGCEMLDRKKVAKLTKPMEELLPADRLGDTSCWVARLRVVRSATLVCGCDRTLFHCGGTCRVTAHRAEKESRQGDRGAGSAHARRARREPGRCDGGAVPAREGHAVTRRSYGSGGFVVERGKLYVKGRDAGGRQRRRVIGVEGMPKREAERALRAFLDEETPALRHRQRRRQCSTSARPAGATWITSKRSGGSARR